MSTMILIATSPLWLGHFVYRRLILSDRKWTLQKSLDFVWEGDPLTGEARRFVNRARRRANWPTDLRNADIYLEYGRASEAKKIIGDYLVVHPGDPLALSLMERATELGRKRK